MCSFSLLALPFSLPISWKFIYLWHLKTLSERCLGCGWLCTSIISWNVALCQYLGASVTALKCSACQPSLSWCLSNKSEWMDISMSDSFTTGKTLLTVCGHLAFTSCTFLFVYMMSFLPLCTKTGISDTCYYETKINGIIVQSWFGGFYSI